MSDFDNIGVAHGFLYVINMLYKIHKINKKQKRPYRFPNLYGLPM